jgi:hypothetical protein
MPMTRHPPRTTAPEAGRRFFVSHGRQRCPTNPETTLSATSRARLYIRSTKITLLLPAKQRCQATRRFPVRSRYACPVAPFGGPGGCLAVSPPIIPEKAGRTNPAVSTQRSVPFIQGGIFSRFRRQTFQRTRLELGPETSDNQTTKENCAGISPSCTGFPPLTAGCLCIGFTGARPC